MLEEHSSISFETRNAPAKKSQTFLPAEDIITNV